MKTKLCFMIMEGPGDEIKIEVYKDASKALEAFKNLKGKPTDPKRRATFLLIDHERGAVVHFDRKDLPIIEDPKEQPWGHRIGEGPMEDPEKSSEGAGN